MTTRRSFLGAILAAAAAPAIIRSGILMPVAPRLVVSGAAAVWKPKPYIADEVTVVSTTGGLRSGDVFTIAGIVGASGLNRRFVVSSVSSSGVLTMQAA